MVYCQMKKFFVLFMAIVLTVSILGGCFVSPVQVQAEEVLTVEEPTAEAAPVIEEPTAEVVPAVEEPTVEEPPAVDEPALKEPEVKKEDPPAVEESTVEEAEEEPKVEEPAAEEPKAAIVLVRYYGADEKLIREDKVVIGQAPPLPPLAPTVEGQVFVHWYLVNDKLSGNSSLKYDFNLPVRGALNLRALYVASTPAEGSVEKEREEALAADVPAVKEPVEEAQETPAADMPAAEEPKEEAEEAAAVDNSVAEEPEVETEEAAAVDDPAVEEPEEEAEEVLADDALAVEEPEAETKEAPTADAPAVEELVEEAEETPAVDDPASEQLEEEAEEAPAADASTGEEPVEEVEETPADDAPVAEASEEEAEEVPAEEALVRLSVALAVEGEEAQDGAYQALLTGGNLPDEGIAVTNIGDQFIFPELAFTAQDAGIHVLLVQTLVQEPLPLHSYDLRAQEIRVEVLADENGHVTALVSYPLEADYLLIAHSVQTRVPTARVHANLQPGQIINYGDEVVFSAEINDCGQSPRIQWQYSPDNENWADIAGGNDVTLSVQITPSNASGYWRVIVTMGD